MNGDPHLYLAETIGIEARSISSPPYPFTEFVVKIYQRCNLACTYCYMYEMADQSWVDRPVKMSAEWFELFTERVVEHVHTHNLNHISLVLHGGEPLLRGREFIAWAAALIRARLTDVEVDIRVQTNGVHLDKLMLTTLREHRIRVGVSLDGDRFANDRHRRNRKGLSSFDPVMAGISELRGQRFRHLFASIFSTIDVRNDPVETYEFLRKTEVPVIDFLLPHANWETPPPRYGDSPTPYGDWLIAVFDHWYGRSDDSTSIRLFHNILVGVLGGQSELETIGLSPSRSVFVDSDGSIEQVDSLKSAYEGAASTSMDLKSHSFDDAMHHPSMISRQSGKRFLSEQCKSCNVVDVCGGGYYPHRYLPDSGFVNPSVYCADLMLLIQHIRSRVEKFSAGESGSIDLDRTTKGRHHGEFTR